MPGLANPESQLGIPLLVRGELVGVLCLESDIAYRFHVEDKSSIELLGSYLAIAVQNMQLQERSAETAEAPSHAPVRRGARPPAPPPSERAARRDIVYYATDECILLDGEYLIRSLPAKILWRLLLLRRRLQQKSPDIRLVPRARGRFALELACEVSLSVRP